MKYELIFFEILLLVPTVVIMIYHDLSNPFLKFFLTCQPVNVDGNFNLTIAELLQLVFYYYWNYMYFNIFDCR